MEPNRHEQRFKFTIHMNDGTNTISYGYFFIKETYSKIDTPLDQAKERVIEMGQNGVWIDNVYYPSQSINRIEMDAVGEDE